MNTRFSERVKLLRQGKKLTQTALADKLNMTKSMISAFESDARLPSLETVVALAQYFDVSIDYILGLRNGYVDYQNDYLLVGELTESQKVIVQEVITEYVRLNKGDKKITGKKEHKSSVGNSNYLDSYIQQNSQNDSNNSNGNDSGNDGEEYVDTFDYFGDRDGGNGVVRERDTRYDSISEKDEIN